MKNRQTKEDFKGSKKKKNTLNDTEMMDACHNAFVQIRRLCNTKGEP